MHLWLDMGGPELDVLSIFITRNIESDMGAGGETHLRWECRKCCRTGRRCHSPPLRQYTSWLAGYSWRHNIQHGLIWRSSGSWQIPTVWKKDYQVKWWDWEIYQKTRDRTVDMLADLIITRGPGQSLSSARSQESLCQIYTTAHWTVVRRKVPVLDYSAGSCYKKLSSSSHRIK